LSWFGGNVAVIADHFWQDSYNGQAHDRPTATVAELIKHSLTDAVHEPHLAETVIDAPLQCDIYSRVVC